MNKCCDVNYKTNLIYACCRCCTSVGLQVVVYLYTCCRLNTSVGLHELLSLSFSLLDIVSIAPQDSFVKLTVSSLNYSRDGNTRPVLAKALCSATEVTNCFTHTFDFLYTCI